MYEHVLLPLATAPHDEAPLSHALELAGTYGAKLHVLHVADLVDQARFADGRRSTDAARELVDKVGDSAREAGIEVDGEVRDGTPQEEILAYVEEAGIDLVVMGTHGKQGLARVLLGSTSEEVLRRCPVPVLTVRADSGP